MTIGRYEFFLERDGEILGSASSDDRDQAWNNIVRLALYESKRGPCQVTDGQGAILGKIAPKEKADYALP